MEEEEDGDEVAGEVSTVPTIVDGRMQTDGVDGVEGGAGGPARGEAAGFDTGRCGDVCGVAEGCGFATTLVGGGEEGSGDASSFAGLTGRPRLFFVS